MLDVVRFLYWTQPSASESRKTMIYDTKIVQGVWTRSDEFIARLNAVIDIYDRQGLIVEVQYAAAGTSTACHLTALVIARRRPARPEIPEPRR